MNERLRIRDHGTVLTITYDNCVRYHGRTNIGGVAVGFRLLQKAFSELSVPLPDRERISFFTAFPGAGVRDAVEMVTRAVSRERYRVDIEYDEPEAPAAAAGRFYFSLDYDDRSCKLAIRPGVVPDEFIVLGRRCRIGQGTEVEMMRWSELKEELAVATMAASPDELFIRLA